MDDRSHLGCTVRPHRADLRYAGGVLRGMETPAIMPIGGATSERFFADTGPTIGVAAYNADFVQAQLSVASDIVPDVLSSQDHVALFPDGTGRTHAQAIRHGQSVGLRNLRRATNKDVHRKMLAYEPQIMERGEWIEPDKTELPSREMIGVAQGS